MKSMVPPARSLALATFLAGMVVPRLQAASFVGFETVGTGAATDSLVLAEQYRPALGIRFSRVDGTHVLLAKRGAPCTAFGAGPDTVARVEGDSLLPDDRWTSSVGDFFVTLSGTPSSALVIDYDHPTSAAAGLLLDVDADETWVVRAYSDGGATLEAETVVTGGTPGTGDQTATPWAITRPTADIVQLRIVQTGGNAHAGAALDRFFPHGTFVATEVLPALKIVVPPTSSVGLQLAGVPGRRYRIEHADSLASGNWMPDQVLTALTPFTALTGVVDSAPGHLGNDYGALILR